MQSFSLCAHLKALRPQPVTLPLRLSAFSASTNLISSRMGSVQLKVFLGFYLQCRRSYSKRLQSIRSGLPRLTREITRRFHTKPPGGQMTVDLVLQTNELRSWGLEVGAVGRSVPMMHYILLVVRMLPSRHWRTQYVGLKNK